MTRKLEAKVEAWAVVGPDNSYTVFPSNSKSAVLAELARVNERYGGADFRDRIVRLFPADPAAERVVRAAVKLRAAYHEADHDTVVAEIAAFKATVHRYLKSRTKGRGR